MPNYDYNIRTDLDTSWMADGNCVGIDPDLMFPTEAGRNNATEAKAICADCTVRDACLDYATAAPERFGVWGGKSESERRTMREYRRRELRRERLRSEGHKVIGA